MTLKQLAEDYTPYRLRKVCRKLESGNSSLPFPRGLMDAECAAGGAAAILCLIRDLFYRYPDRNVFNRENMILVILGNPEPG